VIPKNAASYGGQRIVGFSVNYDREGKKESTQVGSTAELWLVDDCLEDFTIFSPNSVSTLRGSYSNLKAGA
jgi:hypothetical protein